MTAPNGSPAAPGSSGGASADAMYALVEVPPRFVVTGPSAPPAVAADERVRIVLRPGSAFGDGKHETTRLCLQAIAALAPREVDGWRLLDFGSGTGILSLGAAKLGAIAVGVELDEVAIASAVENATLSGVADRVSFGRSLPPGAGAFDVVVANILRSVLVDFSADLVAHLAPAGTLILSGLVSTDVPEVTARYAKLLGGARPEVYARAEWRALLWRRARVTR